MAAFCLDALFCVSRLYQRSGGGGLHTIVRDFMPLTREIMRCQRANSLCPLRCGCNCDTKNKTKKLDNKSATLYTLKKLHAVIGSVHLLSTIDFCCSII